MDRNQRIAKPFREQFKSLSARRAWIEIMRSPARSGQPLVALRKESVDRNKITDISETWDAGRSPQGERG